MALHDRGACSLEEDEEVEAPTVASGDTSPGKPGEGAFSPARGNRWAPIRQ